MEKKSGIILKTYFPYKNKIAVLESSGNKVYYVAPTHDLCAGMMLYYSSNQTHQQSLQFMHSIEKVALPLEIARENIVFLHQLLELMYYFVPTGISIPEIFDSIKELYLQEYEILSERIKKCYLAHFFIHAGIDPESPILEPSIRSFIACGPFDRVGIENLPLEYEHTLDRWVKACITMHPYHAQFKACSW